MTSQRAAGQRWERAAESFLRKKGMKTLERNFNCRVGEIDLVMRDGDVLVFAEVRFRSTRFHGGAAGSVTRVKQQRIIRAAQRFLQLRPQHPATVCRFDVVSIGQSQGGPLIDWIPAAFEA